MCDGVSVSLCDRVSQGSRVWVTECGSARSVYVSSGGLVTEQVAAFVRTG
jgi:hypothetical protein